jgi:hypothetical protein
MGEVKILNIRILNEVENPANDNVDVIVELSTGRSYAFTVYTLEKIRDVMETQTLDFFLCPNLLIVKEIRMETIRKALQSIANTMMDFGALHEVDEKVVAAVQKREPSP